MRIQHSQKEVIDVLLENSEEFRMFYSDYKTTLEKLNIHWFENSNLENGLCKSPRNGTFEIELKRIPPQNEAAFVVAHEVYHAILWDLKYPILSAPRGCQCRKFMGSLTSMVYDHYINAKLRDFFDVGYQLIKLRSQQYFDQKLRDRDNIEDTLELETLFVYVNLRSNFEILCDASEIYDSDFFRWFDSYRPDLVTNSSGLISRIGSTDFGEPKNVEKLFQEIIIQNPTLEPIQVFVL